MDDNITDTEYVYYIVASNGFKHGTRHGSPFVSLKHAKTQLNRPRHYNYDTKVYESDKDRGARVAKFEVLEVEVPCE